VAFSLRLWQQPPLALREAPESIEIPLLPSRRARRARQLLCLAACAYPLELMWHDQWLAGVGALALALMLAWACRAAAQAQNAVPRRLLITADSRVFLLRAGSPAMPLQLSAASLRLGPHLLLLMHSEKGAHRLLLGPDNLPAQGLAALQRRLPAAGGG
jgi:hypothetical protein